MKVAILWRLYFIFIIIIIIINIINEQNNFIYNSVNIEPIQGGIGMPPVTPCYTNWSWALTWWASWWACSIELIWRLTLPDVLGP